MLYLFRGFIEYIKVFSSQFFFFFFFFTKMLARVSSNLPPTVSVSIGTLPLEKDTQIEYIIPGLFFFFLFFFSLIFLDLYNHTHAHTYFWF